MDASEKCAKKVKDLKYIKLDRDGHQDTTYKIATIAGYGDKYGTDGQENPRQRLLTLTYFSQYPDLDLNYDAVASSIRLILLFPASVAYTGWHKTINEMLHSLHGGDQVAIDLRRAAIKRELAISLKHPDQDWLSGLLIHAYGDAYVHTRGTYRSGQEQAYSRVFGHAWDSIKEKVNGFCSSLFGQEWVPLRKSNPDGIKHPDTEPKYLEYVDELYHLLDYKYPPDQSNSSLEAYKAEVKQMRCGVGECPILQAARTLDPDKATNEIEGFAACMSQATWLTPSEVEQAISHIKKDQL